MRSSKSRSRNKSNRNRSVGNIVNRVFDSSGPEGKVRGTPQQIIDKYTQLARDAQLSNDRVAAENFQQHAEHYTRLLGEATREAEARREQQEAQQRDRQQQNQQAREQQQRAPEPEPQPQPEAQQQPKPAAFDDPGAAPQPDIIDAAGEADSGLVETPESRPVEDAAPAPEKPARQRRPRKPKQPPAAEAGDETSKPEEGAPEAAE
ncbi:MAG: DUF4167 domain-containing protein [Pseudomonadota bacterium]